MKIVRSFITERGADFQTREFINNSIFRNLNELHKELLYTVGMIPTGIATLRGNDLSDSLYYVHSSVIVIGRYFRHIISYISIYVEDM